MNTRSSVVHVADFDVDVVRKDIKNLHLAVYPPFGRVRVAAPEILDDEAIRLAVVARLAWVQRKRREVRDQERQSEREMMDGETHYAWGRAYRLRVLEDNARRRVFFTGDGRLELHVPAGADRDARERRLAAWYREELRAAIPGVIGLWAPRLRVDEPSWAIKRMKTKWGTCNPRAHRIWLNLELAKKPRACLEFIVVHELVHLLERNHTSRFYELMDQFMPGWRTVREILNRAPLADEEWGAQAG